MIIWEYFYPGCSILVGKCHPTFTGERNTLNLYSLDQDNPDKNSFCLISKTKTTWKIFNYTDQANLKDLVFVLILMRTAGTTTTRWSIMAEKPRTRFRSPPEKTFPSPGCENNLCYPHTSFWRPVYIIYCQHHFEGHVNFFRQQYFDDANKEFWSHLKISSLWIPEARAIHSGNYTCSPQVLSTPSFLWKLKKYLI